MSASYTHMSSMRLAGLHSQQSSLLQLLQSEIGLVTLLAGVLLVVYMYLTRCDKYHSASLVWLSAEIGCLPATAVGWD